ncbi:Hypothetical predicted protein [Pelobates cultripes]|uniref:Uncharacterized protein n=1 Tax=Pelobates cultripes TaxID=61616 RepID=A0AAD1WMP5_PELCU|nr:Hypothetical predicted protein [Pelobates cultripes]
MVKAISLKALDAFSGHLWVTLSQLQAAPVTRTGALAIDIEAQRGPLGSLAAGTQSPIEMDHPKYLPNPISLQKTPTLTLLTHCCNSTSRSTASSDKPILKKISWALAHYSNSCLAYVTFMVDWRDIGNGPEYEACGCVLPGCI